LPARSRTQANAPGQQGLPGAEQGRADGKVPWPWLGCDLEGAQVLHGKHTTAPARAVGCPGTSANLARPAQTTTRHSKALRVAIA